jgi:alkyldihydroxyacetonephosphate synthase
MLACIEAGIIGQDLERELKNYGVVLGHEPDSIEFSTLGGWISTRASGMKKNAYGNIEDILMNVKLVTTKGTISKNAEWPRVSNGPDLNHVVLGHEGNFGVVTEAVLRVRPIPEVKEYSSIIFHDFEIGIKFMDEVARSRNWPASLRVVDNTQFKASQALREKTNSMTKEFVDMLKMFYVLRIRGFDINKFVGCTVVFEGTRQEVDNQKANLYKIAAKFNGLVAGSENGLKGYFLTFAIAYVRDFAAQYCYIAESFETSCPWSKVSTLCAKVRERLIKACSDRGIK